MAWLRQCEIIIGEKGGDGFKIDALKIAFEIEKTDDPEPNTSKISIYNLSQNTHNKVCVAGNHIELKAGYKDDVMATIFFGDVVKGQRIRDGNDFITEIEVNEGRTATFSADVSLSYVKDTTANQIAADLLDAIGLPYKGLDKVPEESLGAFMEEGNAARILKDVLNPFELTYTIQNEQIYILAEGESAEDTGLLLTPDTGLLTIPQPVSDKTNDGDISIEAADKWSFNTLLFPQLLPGVACEIESSTLNGVVRLTKTKFSGDNWEGDFIAELEGEVL